MLSAPLIWWAQCHLAPKQKFKIEVHYSMGAAWPLTLTECGCFRMLADERMRHFFVLQ